MLDWLPWSHSFAGLGSLGRIFTLGGSYYIDNGRPLPGLFEYTIENLREVTPTLFATVPVGWVQLSAALERDASLAQSFFRQLQYVSYGGAGMSRVIWERFLAVARSTIGEQILFTSSFGATETAASGLNYNRPEDDMGNIGVPNPGVEVKLVPLVGSNSRYGIRMRSQNVFTGYLKRPDLTQAAFDDEGFYCLGDAVVLSDPRNPEAGLRYAGRCLEDFKLATGTWVRAGSVRLALIERCAPLITDAIIFGHDQDYIVALA
ncbi:AMP-binding enzyme [Polaromonas sp. OV174]|nr:AMP-binding enzyme [Polaromonas sp. OV174]